MAVDLLPSAARTASGNAQVTSPLGPVSLQSVQRAVFFLDVTAAATDVGDTLDVYIQQSPDNGTNWDDFVHFTQVLGNGGVKQFIAEWSAFPSAESELHAKADGSLAAGVLQGPVSETWRVKWVVVDAGTVNVSFTFAVKATLISG